MNCKLFLYDNSHETLVLDVRIWISKSAMNVHDVYLHKRNMFYNFRLLVSYMKSN